MGAWRTLVDDFRAVRERDPAIPAGIRGFFEIALCTPGFQAVAAHRLIHFLHARLHIPVLPRFLALIVRWWTGTEIHPGARIGKGVFIDHAAAVMAAVPRANQKSHPAARSARRWAREDEFWASVTRR